MLTDKDWAADALTRKSVSCIVERYGSRMFDSVANNFWLHCPLERHEFHCFVSGNIEGNFTDLGTDRDAIGGDHFIRQ